MPKAMKYSDVSAQDRTNYQLYAHKYGWRDCWTAQPEEGFQYMHEDRKRFFYMLASEEDIPAKAKIVRTGKAEGCTKKEGCFRPDCMEVR